MTVALLIVGAIILGRALEEVVGLSVVEDVGPLVMDDVSVSVGEEVERLCPCIMAH